jgi:hypothetical protein
MALEICKRSQLAFLVRPALPNSSPPCEVLPGFEETVETEAVLFSECALAILPRRSKISRTN